jgi:DNA-binding transcriptional MerR regulator
MTPPSDRTYRTAAFAALAGVTSRALRHYDRLGLLKPQRSSSGYRLYSARDLERLEEIVALKFIGIPLKQIAAMQHHADRSFVDVLHAQLESIDARRRVLTRAIAAVPAAEASLRSGTSIDAALFRQIIEVMHMDTTHEETMAKYSAMLRAKISHLTAMSADERAAMKQQWTALVEDVKGALDEPPASPKAQGLLNRWHALHGALTGTHAVTAIGAGAEPAFRDTPERRDELWARRAEWLPADAGREQRDPAEAEQALAQARERIHAFASSDVLAFIERARAARGRPGTA